MCKGEVRKQESFGAVVGRGCSNYGVPGPVTCPGATPRFIYGPVYVRATPEFAQCPTPARLSQFSPTCNPTNMAPIGDAKAIQHGNKQRMSVPAAICADGSALRASLMYEVCMAKQQQPLLPRKLLLSSLFCPSTTC